jgi:hypothetical protein
LLAHQDVTISLCLIIKEMGKKKNPRDEALTIGKLGEKSLHSSICAWYAQPGDCFEIKVSDYIIDIVREKMLIEIQTGNFTAFKMKLTCLLEQFPIRIVHPIPRRKWIVRLNSRGEIIQRRKSPKKGDVRDIFDELVYIPELLLHPNLSIEVLLTEQEVILQDDHKGSWRRKYWSIKDHRLLKVLDRRLFSSLDDYMALLPTNLEFPFTNQELANALENTYNRAQKMTYVLRKAGALQKVGSRSKSYLYDRAVISTGRNARDQTTQ